LNIGGNIHLIWKNLSSPLELNTIAVNMIILLKLENPLDRLS